MGSSFSSLRSSSSSGSSILPTTVNHNAHSASSSAAHGPSPSSFFSPALTSLLGSTIPLSSPYWSTSLLELCLSLSQLSGVTSALVHAVLLRSCRQMQAATVLHHHRNLQHLMLVLAFHIQRLVATPAAFTQHEQQQHSASAPAAASSSSSSPSGSALRMDGLMNLLFLCRNFLHYSIQHSSIDQLNHCFAYTSPPYAPSTAQPSASPPLSASTSPSDLVSPAAVFISALYRLIVSLPVSSSTYELQLEALNTLQTLFSSQLYHPSVSLLPALHPFLSRCVADPQLTAQAPALMLALLQHQVTEVCAHFERPQSQHAHSLPAVSSAPLSRSASSSSVLPSSSSSSSPSSLLTSLRSSLSTILLLPFQIFRYFFPPAAVPYPMADRSLITFLLLAHQHHWPQAGVVNPYRLCLASMTDADDPLVTSSPASAMSVSYDAVYASLLYTLPSPPSVLLLFSLLHLSPSFLSYVYAKTEIELLILPLLHALYDHIKSIDSAASTAAKRPSLSSASASSASSLSSSSSELSSEQRLLYVLLIILLLLSADSSFIHQSHRHLLHRVPWHTDTYLLQSISLASFTALLLLRLLHHHLTLPNSDSYVVSNVLAVLSNLAAASYHLHPAVIRRMITVLEVVSKKYKRLRRKERMLRIKAGAAAESTVAEEAGAAAEGETAQFLQVVSQYLSVLCSCAHPDRLHENVQLVYWLMNEKRHVLLLSDEARLGIDLRTQYLLGLCAHFELVVDVYYRQQKKSASALHILAPPPALSPTAALVASSLPSSLPSALPSSVPLSAARPPLLHQTAHNSEIDPVLAVIAADAQQWRHTLADSSLGSCIERVEGFRYEEEAASDEFIIPFLWDINAQLGAWREWKEEDGQQPAAETDGEQQEAEEEQGLLTSSADGTDGEGEGLVLQVKLVPGAEAV